MSFQKQSRSVTQEEYLLDAAAIVAKDPDDVLGWLMGERLLETAKREEHFQTNNLVLANQHEERVKRLGSTIVELTKLRQINEDIRRVLVNRIMVALDEAQSPAWKATHRHYKGALYRVTGKRFDANGEELVESIEYDDAAGNRYFLHRTRFEGALESGRLRYQPLVTGD